MHGSVAALPGDVRASPLAAAFFRHLDEAEDSVHAATVTRMGLRYSGRRRLQRRWLRVEEDARVYEINHAQDWQELVRRYPTSPAPDAPLGPCVSVDWSAVSRDWDGVHLSFAGLLFASYVVSEVPGGVTYLWSWDTEQTLWLNQAWSVGESTGEAG